MHLSFRGRPRVAGPGLAMVLALLITATAAPSNPPAADAPKPPPPPQSVWRQDESGNAEHLQSGLKCARYRDDRDYYQSRLTVYDHVGFDVSCNYVDRSGNTITVYLTRRSGQTLDADFAEAQRQLKLYHPEGAPLADDQQSTFPSSLDFTSLVYSFKGGEVESGVWVADIHGWTLKLRASYKPSDRKQIFSMLSNLAGDVAEGVGQTLSVCANSPDLDRKGGKVETSPSELSSILVPLGAFLVARDLPSGATAQPSGISAGWCAERQVDAAKYPTLLWRHIISEAFPQGADLLTVTSKGISPTLVSEPSAAALEGLGPAWVVTVRDENAIHIVGFFDARPSETLLAPYMDALIDGTLEPLATLEKTSSTDINIEIYEKSK